MNCSTLSDIISRSRLVTKTIYPIHYNNRRGIISQITRRPYPQTDEKPSPFGLNTGRYDSDTRRTKATIWEPVDSKFQQLQLEDHIPGPTWSLQDLELTSVHNAIAEEELNRLARLVLVDVSKNRNNCEDEMIDEMKQNLGNMLHMIKHVTRHNCQVSVGDGIDDTSDTDFGDKEYPQGDADTYDAFRGLTATPLRKTKLDPLEGKDASQALVILDKTLHTKMVLRGGGHKYFAIKTTEP